MGRWRGFLDSLDTNGGHIFIVFCLIPVGAAMMYFDATAGGQIMTGALTALYVMVKSKGTNSEQLARAGKPYEPPQPPPSALTPPIVVGDPPNAATARTDAPPPPASPLVTI